MYKDIAELASGVLGEATEQRGIDPVNLAKLYKSNPHLHTGIDFE
jgi:hypothetical protein